MTDKIFLLIRFSGNHEDYEELTILASLDKTKLDAELDKLVAEKQRLQAAREKVYVALAEWDKVNPRPYIEKLDPPRCPTWAGFKKKEITSQMRAVRQTIMDSYARAYHINMAPVIAHTQRRQEFTDALFTDAGFASEQFLWSDDYDFRIVETEMI